VHRRAVVQGIPVPAEIINHCAWLYYLFPRSFLEVEEMMLKRGIVVSHEAIRQWYTRFGQTYANALWRRRARPGRRHRRRRKSEPPSAASVAANTKVAPASSLSAHCLQQLAAWWRMRDLSVGGDSTIIDGGKRICKRVAAM
jgi:hypothetical protein